MGTPHIKKEDLYRLLKDESFLSLEKEFNTFNIFNALGLETAENRHSSFLAFLLNPRESHQFESLFLKEFLQEAFPNQAIQFENLDLTDIIVHKEYKFAPKAKDRLDILLLDEKNGILYAIEHKIKAKEHKRKSSTQLKFYKEGIQKNKKFDRYKEKYYIFLTAQGNEPSDKDWIPVSYDNIEGIIQRILKFYDYKLLPELKTILEQYLLVIKRSILMSDDNLEELAQRVYQNHRKVLDYIIENMSNPDLHAMHFIKSIFANHDNLFEMNHTGKSSAFYSFKELDKYEQLQYPDSDRNSQYKKSYLGFYIERNKKGVIMKAIIGPTKKNFKFRKALETYLIKNKYTQHRKPTANGVYHTISTDILIPKKHIEELFENKNLEEGSRGNIERIILARYKRIKPQIEEAIKILSGQE